MTTEAMLSCCCACLQCPCHAIYGGKTSYVATWFGSVTVEPGPCHCPNYPFTERQISTHRISGLSTKFKWSNPIDPLNCNLVPNVVDGNRIKDGPFIFEYYANPNPNEECIPIGSLPLGNYGLEVAISIIPPKINCVTGVQTPWSALATIIGLESFLYESKSMSCDAPGMMKGRPISNNFTSGICNGYNGLSSIATWTMGGFSIT